MSIGDDWFTKAMVLNTLSRTQRVKSQQSMTNTSTQVDKLFSEVLNELMAKQGIYSASDSSESSIPSGVLMDNMLNGFDPTLKNIVFNNESLRFTSMDPEKLNQLLDGKLKGMGQVFVQAGQTYNVDPALLAAVAQHESGNGKSKAAIVKNNIAGMMGANGLKSYASVQESIMDMARNLSANYLGKGLSNISSIGAKYAPVGAKNDPTGLNNYWVKGVSNYYDRLKQLV